VRSADNITSYEIRVVEVFDGDDHDRVLYSLACKNINTPQGPVDPTSRLNPLIGR
jgi:hypothetical protein